MAIENVNATKKAPVIYVWKTLAIPDSKLKVIWTDAKTGRVSMGFEIADVSGCQGMFYVPVKNVKRNKDATGFLVQMPEKETSISVKNADGTKEKFVAQKLEDLGYPLISQ